MNLQAPELILILVIVLLLFGAKKLPDLASSMGRSIKSFRRASQEEDDAAAAEAAATTTTEAGPAA